MTSHLRRAVPTLLLCLCFAASLEAQLSPITITSGNPPNAAVGTGYPVFPLTAADTGCPGASFAYTGIGLPSWLTIVTNGGASALEAVGSGATTSGPVTFTITANDTCSLAGGPTSSPTSATYTIQVSSPPELYYGVPRSGIGNSGITQPFVIQSLTTQITGMNTTYVTCNDTASTDPCYVEDGVNDLTLDNSGNFVVAGYTAHLYGPSSEYASYVTTFPAAGGIIPTAPLFTVSASEVPPSLQSNPSIPDLASIVANFSSVFVDIGGNYVVLDTGNGAVLFCPPNATSCTVVAKNIGSGGTGGVIRSDGGNNYIVAVGQTGGSDGYDQTQVYRFPACNPSTKVCPATVDATNAGLLAGGSSEGTSNGTLFGDAFGLTIANGSYYVATFGDAYYPAQIIKINPSPNVQVVPFYTNSQIYNDDTYALGIPGGLTYDAQTGNFLVGDATGALLAISSDGIGTGAVSIGGPVGAFVVKQGAPLVNGLPLTLTGVTLPPATAGVPYSATISAFGGTAPYVYGASGLPAGITLNQTTGGISGTTTQTGTFTVQVVVTDQASGFAQANFTLVVAAAALPAPPPPLQLSGSLGSAFADEPYSAGFGASGGAPPYTYSATGLPSGISINQNNGAVSGQTTQTGSFTVQVAVTDSSGASAGGSFTLTVAAPPPVTLTGSNLGSVTAGTPVSLVIAASGGAPPYTYALAGGTPPPGLSLLSSGTLHGTPLSAGSYAFSVKATDSTGGTATGAFTIAILPPPLTITSPSPFATGTVSLGYPTQSITAKGGTAPYSFAVTSGALPAGLTLSSTGIVSGTPTAATASTGATFTVTATDSSATPSTGAMNLSITVQPFTENLVLSSGSLAFALDAGTLSLPPSQMVGVQSTMVNQPITYTVAVQPASATWLSASSGSTTPGTLSVSLTQAALALAASTNPYTANIVVTCMSSGCSGNSQTLPVMVTVTSPPPVLSVQATPVTFDTPAANPQTLTQSVAVANTGGGGIGFASISCGAPWCTVSGAPASLGAQTSTFFTITANPAGLAAGYYYSAVSFVSSVGSASLPVTLTIEPSGLISLSPAGAEFSVPQGGLLTPGSFLVDITGSTPVGYSATVTSGSSFLTVTNGVGSASGSAPGTVTYSFNASAVSKLTPGTYYGTISVAAAGATNSPQSYEVVVSVTPPSTPSVPSLTPGGLIFLTQPNATPPAQTISVVSFSTSQSGFQASASTMTGGNWLSATPATGTTVGGTPGTVSVTANPSGLTPGVYKGAVNFAFSGTTAVRSVNVTLVVENVNSSSIPAISSKEHPNAAGTCTPSQLVPTSTGLVGDFSAPAAWPVPLSITLVDDCGDLVTNGQIVATFSNGDPPLILTLSDPTMASYAATWTPEHSSGQITINARATAPNLPVASTQIGGAVTPNNAPILADLAIANFFNPIGGAPLSPGTLVQITGQYLAGQTMNAPSIPLPLTLGGTSVIIGGVQAPVSMVSPGQVNVQVPFELPAGQPYQVIINANNALTTPQSFQAGDASPGLSVLPSGYVQASHQSGAAVTEAAPAKPGESISIYLVGMGATTIPVASGNPGPSGTFATTTINPQVAVNNEAATVSFSGLIPGLVGVYQVNFAVPSDVPNGDQILTLAENAFSSNSGLLPVHN